MLNNKIAVIGDKDLILAFKAVGMDVFSANGAEDAAALIKKLAGAYAVIFITEDIAAALSETLEKYKERAYPAIIPIPASQGSNGFGLSGIKRDVERAVGTDILFNDEE